MRRVDLGDDSLESLLDREGVALSVGQIHDIVAGVAAAPVGPEPDAWIDLVSRTASRELRAVLRSLVEQARAAPANPASAFDARLADLRGELRRRRLSGFVVPRGDEHQGEYVASRSERLAWLTGFTGSAGTAVVLTDRAAIFVDGRYTVQVRAEVDLSSYEIRHSVEEPVRDWLASHLRPLNRLGFDPWLHTRTQVEDFREACERAGARLVAVPDNPLDRLWTDQPPPPIAPVSAHDSSFSGASSADKRRQAAEALGKANHDATILSAPESLCWLLNIRGGDVPYAPLALSFAVLHADATVELFIDRRKLAFDPAEHLGDGVVVAPPDDFGPALDRLGAQAKVVRFDPDGSPEWAVARLARAGAKIAKGADPCTSLKAKKNPVELDGMRAAHRRDGAALTRFLAWLACDRHDDGLSEMEVADRLAAFRRANAHYRGPSFPTISAAGSNAAIVHYRAKPETNHRLEAGALYLVDSGGQYLDGTTDVTRTVAIGTPSDEMRSRFTRVLKGHIALATCRFPQGTSGSQLDTLARLALWSAGLDYDHGTGHGVGHYLCVHEGPQRVAKSASRVALEPGMILSNEPGYYKAGEYGIRIENLVAVISVEAPAGAEKPLLGFETLTLAPIDRTLIATPLMTAEEIAWVDAYHAGVREILSPLVDFETALWLDEATRPLADAGPIRSAISGGSANGRQPAVAPDA